jgi:hypothetical protein
MTTAQSHRMDAETTPCDSGDRFQLWLDTYRRHWTILIVDKEHHSVPARGR